MRRIATSRACAAFVAFAVVIGLCSSAHAQSDNLAALDRQVSELYSTGKYSEAIPLAERSLELTRAQKGGDHLDTAVRIGWLAALYQGQGRSAEAESLYKRAISLFEKALGPDNPNVGASLNNLAELYRSQGRFAEAEPLFKRSLAIVEKMLGTNHAHVGASLNNLAELYRSQGRFAEAEPLFKRSLAIVEKALGTNHPHVGFSLVNLAGLYESQGRFAEAEPLFKRSLAIVEKAFGADHPDVALSLNSLAVLYRSQGRFAEAEPLFKRSLAIVEKAFGADHPHVGSSLNNLAALFFAQSDWARAADYWRRSTGVMIRRAERGTMNVGHPPGKGKTAAEQSRSWGFVKVAFRLASERRGGDLDLAAEMFQIAQWAQGSEAAASLVQMAARSATGSTELGRVVRERQDLVAEWQLRDAAHIAAVSRVPAKRDYAAEAANTTRLAAIDVRIAEIDNRLAAEFPDYAALARPAPLSLADAQAALRDDEALILFLDTPEWKPTPEETFIWVVTKTQMRWVRSQFGKPALTREVAALRCGLDATSWRDEGRLRCAELLKIAPDKAPAGVQPLPFDLTRAHALYKALFGQIEDLIQGKHLLLVPSGQLTQLPFQVLVTAAPTRGDYMSVSWLTREHALTVLPAASSLKALRRVAKPSAATLPMIGFGNPLLEGNQSHPQFSAHYKKQAKLARDNQRCPEAQRQRVATSDGIRGGVAPVIMRDGLADLAHLKAQLPLPETADELCAVARDLKAGTREIRLGARATEREVKALSLTGALARYRIVHFATHGALAGQLTGTTEPGLILTPPATASQEDDGYLSASEIAGLKFDADWVILSACNTAGGGATSAEALSGLARAFFYAQARALLVSHWEVDSAATIKLISSAVRAMTADSSVGRAEALRRSMLALIGDADPLAAHPAYWAPFVVVGEGAR